MKRVSIVLMFVAAIALSTPLEAFARGGGRGGGARGGGGGMRGGGGGMSRPSAGRSPSFSGSRPSPSTRPSTGSRPSSRPGGATTRPGGSGTRPGGATTRPGGSGTRPGGAGTRPSTRPGGVRPGGEPGGRPSAGQLNDFLDIPAGPRGPSSGTRPGAGGAAADFLQRPQAGQLPVDRSRVDAVERPGAVAPRPGVEAPIAVRPGVGGAGAVREGVGVAAGVAGGAAAGRLANHRPERIENRQQWQDNRQQRRGEVWDQVQDNHPRLDFWTDHPNWAAWRINRPYRWATWGAVAGWVGYGWGEPVSYGYGDDIYYNDGQVYSGDQPVATAEEYAEQAETIAQSAPEEVPADSEWMPLGVFAVTQDGEATGAEPTLFMQLAISKQGVITGTFKNMATGQVQTLEGMADKESQRVAWCVQGTQYPIVETGISNLTQDTTPVLVHFEDGQTQQWLLVRLPEPKDGESAPAP